MPSHRVPAMALLVAVILTVGCLGGTPAGTTEPTSPTRTATASPTPTSSPLPPVVTTAKTTVTTANAQDIPSPSHLVILRNDWSRSVEMHVRIVRETTNETVLDETYDLSTGTECTVYDTADANPDGIERFTVTVTARNTTESVPIRTSRCFGDAYADVTEDGELSVYYAIC